MNTAADRGIDYGMGRTNIDQDTGIRYGVISINDCAEWAIDQFEADYGDASCPGCGGEVVEYDDDRHDAYADPRGFGGEYACEHCRLVLDADETYPEAALGWELDDGLYRASMGEDSNIFVTRSPYVTYAQFCSPCAPGAGYLRVSGTKGSGLVRTYCLGPEWFEGTAPYPVYDAKTGKRVRA